MSNLTLWDIEKGIAELFDAREEAETPEARQACDQALAEYFAREVMSVDRIRGAYKHFEALATAAAQEIRDMQTRKAMFERRCESIKARTAAVFEANPQLGNKIEGRTGRLLYKGNGGVQPLEVTDPAAVPDECCKYVGWISGEMWRAICEALPVEVCGKEFALERTVDQERTRAALKTCEACNGTGKGPSMRTCFGDDEPAVRESKCSACDGSGKGGVPGARLLERGKHVEVK